jgi:transcriptional regulator GlxA family with amidase domain
VADRAIDAGFQDQRQLPKRQQQGHPRSLPSVRRALVDAVRSEQSVYVMCSLPKNHGDGDILRVQHWLEEHFEQPLLIDDVAQRFGFGVRNFKRRFKEATGYTPITYLQTLRLEKAKQLLESTRMTLDSITYAVGYEDGNSFRRLFRQRVGLLPAAYRKKFQAGAS